MFDSHRHILWDFLSQICDERNLDWLFLKDVLYKNTIWSRSKHQNLGHNQRRFLFFFSASTFDLITVSFESIFRKIVSKKRIGGLRNEIPGSMATCTEVLSLMFETLSCTFKDQTRLRRNNGTAAYLFLPESRNPLANGLRSIFSLVICRREIGETAVECIFSQLLRDKRQNSDETHE